MKVISSTTCDICGKRLAVNTTGADRYWLELLCREAMRLGWVNPEHGKDLQGQWMCPSCAKGEEVC